MVSEYCVVKMKTILLGIFSIVALVHGQGMTNINRFSDNFTKVYICSLQYFMNEMITFNRFADIKYYDVCYQHLSFNSEFPFL